VIAHLGARPLIDCKNFLVRRRSARDYGGSFAPQDGQILGRHLSWRCKADYWPGQIPVLVATWETGNRTIACPSATLVSGGQACYGWPRSPIKSWLKRLLCFSLVTARDYFALKERCIYCDVLEQEQKERKRLIAENEDFLAIAPFASRFPFEMGVLPKSHNSAFSRITPGQIDSLARILRDVLQKVDHTLGGPPYNLSLQDRPFLRPRGGYWGTIEDDFHWHLEILPQIARITGFEWASGFFYNPVPPEVAARCLTPLADA
jgi:diadenosine tetraphosphate (Ap4A) HIT family hydrolase